MKCIRCGHENAAGGQFCSQCGGALDSGHIGPPKQMPAAANDAGAMVKMLLSGLAVFFVLYVTLWLVNNRNRLSGLLRQSSPRILVSRESLSNGRTDVIRPTSEANPMGLQAVAGFPALLATIAAQSNPLRISLDQDGGSGPLTAALGSLPSCFALLVAEDFPVDGTRWENIGNRDGSGSLYAAVSIPSAGIAAGQELISDAELAAYTANSIVYEAPDYGVSPASTIDTKGAIRIRAAPRPQPEPPRVQDLVEAPEIDYARNVKVEIVVVSSRTAPDREIELTLQANTVGFDPLGNSHFRWAFEGDGVTIVKDIVAANRVTFQLPASLGGKLARLWVAASAKGMAGLNPNPFVEQPPKQHVGNMTFVTAGSAVAAMKPHTLGTQAPVTMAKKPPGGSTEVSDHAVGQRNFTGKWQMAVNIAYKMEFDLKQDGDRVSGTLTHAGGTATLTGTVKGKVLNYVDSSGTKGELTMVSENSLKGGYTLADGQSFPFSFAERIKP